MLIKCEHENCEFKEQRKFNVYELVQLKAEHEYLNTGHKVAYCYGINFKIKNVTDPEKVYRGECTTCLNNYEKLHTYETVSKFDLRRHTDFHSKSMAKEDEKYCGMALFHEFYITEFDYKEYEKNAIEHSDLIEKIQLDNIPIEKIDTVNTDIEKGDYGPNNVFQGTNVTELFIAKKMYYGFCPICNHHLIKKYKEPDIAWELTPKELLSSDSPTDTRSYDYLNFFDFAFKHLMKHHTYCYEGNDYEKTCFNIMRELLLCERAISKLRHFYKINRKDIDEEFTLKTREMYIARRDMSLRALNKIGIPQNTIHALIDGSYHQNETQLGQRLYHGMELLGRPNWVKKIESEIESNCHL